MFIIMSVRRRIRFHFEAHHRVVHSPLIRSKTPQQFPRRGTGWGWRGRAAASVADYPAGGRALVPQQSRALGEAGLSHAVGFWKDLVMH